MNTKCPWCAGSMSDEDPATLCRVHLAEWAGETVSELDRADDDARADLS